MSSYVKREARSRMLRAGGAIGVGNHYLKKGTGGAGLRNIASYVKVQGLGSDTISGRRGK
jgi:hypothetical protein